MAVRHLTSFVERLRSNLLKQQGAGTDADLLHRFVQQQDETAFGALVHRHGPMVMGVCNRILRNSHDAEDAFQATFLVLIRKAASIHPPGMVGNWLYGVACRTAQEARKSAAKRRMKEANVVPRTETPKQTWDDLRPVLDQELERLPKKYRAVIVLCDLEGKTRKEVAEQLGWPEGTVAGRLATARTMLAKRLARHGFGASAGVLATMLVQNASACVSPSVVSASVKAGMLFAAGQAAMISVRVITLTEGVLKAMLLSKLTIAAVVLAALGVVVVTCGVLAEQQTDSEEKAAPQAKATNEPKDEQVVRPSTAIKELREKRLTMLKMIRKEMLKRIKVDPTMSIDQVQKAMADIIAARLDLAVSRADRIKVREEAVKEAEEWVKTIVQLHQAKALSNIEALQAEAYVLETRIALEREKVTLPSPPD